MRFDIGNHPLDALHHGREIHRALHAGKAQCRALFQFIGQLGRTQQRLGWHAAGVQAVAAHLVFFDQADLGLHRRRDIGADQATGTRADHQQVTVEGFRFVPTGIHPPRLNQAEQLARDQREHPEQHKGTEQPRREDARQGVQLAEFTSGVHIHQGAGQHAELADPPVGAHRQAGQAHGQVDQKERKQRHQAQGEQVERPFPLHALVDASQALAKAALHPIAQQKTAAEHGQGRAQR